MTCSASDQKAIAATLEAAVEVAEDAGRTLRRFADRHAAGEDLGVTAKTSATDPVSEADEAAERRIAEGLLGAFPDDGLLGEEGQTNRRGTSGRRWVVDPLDGTVNFLYGIPAWCVSIACEDEHGSLVGVVHDPTRGETFRASRDGGAWLGQRRLQVGAPTELGHAMLATGFAYDPPVRREWGGAVADLLGRVRDVRRFGSAALDLAWTAAGRFDAYLEFGLSPWDWAAGTLLVTEAGGTVSRPSLRLGGRPRPGVLAAGASVHEALAVWVADRGGQPDLTDREDRP
jgi:myo-inositol-1(or 4)-monophosphatase